MDAVRPRLVEPLSHAPWCPVPDPHRRSYVFNLAMLGWVASGSLIMGVSAFLKHDEAEARARIRSSLPTA
jgi:hypothetical protein